MDNDTKGVRAVPSAVISPDADAEEKARCPICHDFQSLTWRSSNAWLPHDVWATRLSTSSCRRCRILFGALEKLQPEFLDLNGESSSTFAQCSGAGGRNDVVQVATAQGRPGTSAWDSSKRTTFIQFLVTAEPRYGSPEQFLPVARIPGDASMWKFIRNRLDTCLKTHKLCASQQNPTWYPRRLLFLHSLSTGPRKIRLVETSNHTPRERYIALSHCWGSGLPLRATEHTLAKLKSSIDPDELPATFRDCMKVADALLVRYVWIDALCIMQDSPEDWARQSQEMDLVYENALFVVAACESPDSLTPFLGPDAPNERSNSKTATIDYVDDRGGHQKAFARIFDYTYNVIWYYGALENRGWTWQERELATRSVNFLSSQVRWTCRATQVREDGHVIDTWSEHDQEFDSEAWMFHVATYARRVLTYASDRLPAISGMATRFYNAMKCEYLAGLWMDDFPACLGWSHDGFNPAPLELALWEAGPTWSWASVVGFIDWHHNVNSMNKRKRQSQTKLLDFSCMPATSNKFGQVATGSYLTVRGRLVPADLEIDDYGHGIVRAEGLSPEFVAIDCLVEQRINERRRTTVSRVSAPKDSRRAHEMNQEHIKGTVYCLLLYTASLLEKESSDDGLIRSKEKSLGTGACVLILSRGQQNRPVYQRIGLGPPSWADVFEKRANTDSWMQHRGWQCRYEEPHWGGWFNGVELCDIQIE